MNTTGLSTKALAKIKRMEMAISAILVEKTDNSLYILALEYEIAPLLNETFMNFLVNYEFNEQTTPENLYNDFVESERSKPLSRNALLLMGIMTTTVAKENRIRELALPYMDNMGSYKALQELRKKGCIQERGFGNLYLNRDNEYVKSFKENKYKS